MRRSETRYRQRDIPFLVYYEDADGWCVDTTSLALHYPGETGDIFLGFANAAQAVLHGKQDIEAVYQRETARHRAQEVAEAAAEPTNHRPLPRPRAAEFKAMQQALRAIQGLHFTAGDLAQRLNLTDARRSVNQLQREGLVALAGIQGGARQFRLTDHGREWFASDA